MIVATTGFVTLTATELLGDVAAHPYPGPGRVHSSCALTTQVRGIRVWLELCFDTGHFNPIPIKVPSSGVHVLFKLGLYSKTNTARFNNGEITLFMHQYEDVLPATPPQACRQAVTVDHVLHYPIPG